MNSMLMMTTQAEGYDGAANGAPVCGYGEAMEPMLIFTVGERAATLVTAALTQGGTWLGAAPPVWRLDVPLPQGGYFEQTEAVMAGLRQQLSTLCATVAAERGQSVQLHNPGGLNGKGAALSLWVVVDLTGKGKELGRPSGAGGRSGGPAEAALQLLQMMDVVAWQRLQVAVRPQVLLVAQAGDQRGLDECRQRLEVMAPTPYFVVGVTEDGVGAAGAPQAAESVAALLWGAPALTADSAHFLPVHVRYYAVGAAVWPLPTAALRQVLAFAALCAALRDGQVVLAETVGMKGAAAPVTSICALAQQLLDRSALLAEVVPPPVAVAWGRGRPRWWRKALEPARILLAQRQVEQGALRAAQRAARQQWLATQLSAWEEAWQSFNDARLTSRRGAEQQESAAVGQYVDELWQLWHTMLGRVQRVDEELAELADATTKAQTNLQGWSNAVEDCCRELPTLSLTGLWQWCSAPTHWGSWLWKLTITLPRRLQGLAKAVAACEAAVYREANTHLVRQLGLAILQDVQLQRAWLPKVREEWQALTHRSEAALAQQLAALPAPWTPAQVAALGQMMADVGENRSMGRIALDRLLQRTAAAEWAERAGAAMMEALITVFVEESAALEQWSVAEWLAVMFPEVMRQPGDQHDSRRRNGMQAHGAVDALWTWLDQLAEEAKPQWPQGPAGRSSKVGPTSAPQGFLHFGTERAQRPTAKEEGWLILPRQFITAAGVDVAESAPMDVETWLAHQQRDKRITAWLKGHPAWQRAEGSLPGIVMLCRRAIE